MTVKRTSSKKLGKSSSSREKAPTKRKSKNEPFPPNMSVLKSVHPVSRKSVQPDWIREKFPEYVHDNHMDHALISVRSFSHGGHDIKITTSYQIEINGTQIQLHARVDNEGHLHCHTTPYESYSSATDLVKKLIDRYPESFMNLQSSGEHLEHSHEGHGA